jgi:hypothetical protein
MLEIQLNGWMLIAIVMAVGGYVGWRIGLRGFLTITLVSALGYLIFVNGGQIILDYLNNVYVNIPRIVAIITGGDPAAVATWDPLFGNPLALPLPLRVALYLIVVVLSWFFNSRPRWYSAKPDPMGRRLGVFSGALTAMIWASALTTFWIESGGGQDGFLGNVIGILPDVTDIAPWLIALLFLIVMAGVVQNLPKLWQAGGGGK